jgi:hypothetical protein
MLISYDLIKFKVLKINVKIVFKGERSWVVVWEFKPSDDGIPGGEGSLRSTQNWLRQPHQQLCQWDLEQMERHQLCSIEEGHGDIGGQKQNSNASTQGKVDQILMGKTWFWLHTNGSHYSVIHKVSPQTIIHIG